MAIDRTAYNALLDDDGSNTVGTILNKNVLKTVVLDPIDAAIAPRVTATTSSATPTPNADTTDLYSLTAQAAAAAFATPTGTPVNGQPLVIRIKDNATARALTWSAGYVAGGVALPATTVLSKILTITFRYNTDNALNKWQCLYVALEGAASGGAAGAVSGSAYRNSVQAVADSTFVALTFEVEDFQTGTLHSTVTNNSRVTIATTGRYFFFGRVTFAGNATGQRIVALRLNGATFLEMLKFPNNGAVNLLSVQVGRLIQLTAGDYIELVAEQESGGSLNTGDVAGNRYNQNDLSWFQVA